MDHPELFRCSKGKIANGTVHPPGENSTQDCKDLIAGSPVELRLEGVVDGEGVRALDLLGLGALDEDSLTGLADGERLQRPRQLSVGDGGLLLDLVVRVRVTTVEQQQHAHLVPE